MASAGGNQNPVHRGGRQVPENQAGRNNAEAPQPQTIHSRDFLSQYFDQNFTDTFDSDEEYFENLMGIEAGGGFHFRRRPSLDNYNMNLDDRNQPDRARRHSRDRAERPNLPPPFPRHSLDFPLHALHNEDVKEVWEPPDTAVVDKENSRKEASDDEINKNENDEEKEGISTPQTSKDNINCSTTEDGQRKTDQSSAMKDKKNKVDSEDTGTKGTEGKEQIATTKDVAGNVVQSQDPEQPEEDWKEKLNIFDEYPFDESNPMIGSTESFSVGMKALCTGDYALAARCLELSCVNIPPSDKKKSPQWICLGISQMANEQDHLAIIALKKYLVHQPDDLECLIFLTVCFLNEDYKNFAMITLLDWLKYNRSYSDLVDISPSEEMYDVSSPMNLDFHQKLIRLYMRAELRRPSNKIDADVECALGFLYNMVHEYCKATDCFAVALSKEAYDEMLWNHFGEALMNNLKYADSIEAFFNALNFRPRYARARYNLGVACSNLGDYEAAMSQYIKALNIQAESSRGLVGRMSDTIWLAAKVAARILERPDLEEAVEKRDLDFLNSEFPDQELACEEKPSKNDTICRFMRYVLED